MSFIDAVTHQIFTTTPRPGLHPLPGSVPLTIEAAICPPLLYYVALLFLPPPPPTVVDTLAIKILRNVLALLAGFLFFRLPLAYHVPQSIGLTYQLGLVGIYGACRVLDAFFISPYLFGHIPRRVKYQHLPRSESSTIERKDLNKEWTGGGVKDPFSGEEQSNDHIDGHAGKSPKDNSLPRKTSATRASSGGRRRPSMIETATDMFSNAMSGPDPTPVYEHARTEEGWPASFTDRASWALELELSMRGVGFTWTTADVRHTRRTWIPTIQNRLHSITLHVLPILLVCWFIIRSIYVAYLAQYAELPWEVLPYDLFDEVLPLPQQLLLTAALGAFLMAAFSLGHSLFAIMLHPLSPHPLSFFPPLYTTRAWDLTSVRKFWSFGWHRLFARLFLVYGVWPGEWAERKLTGKSVDQPVDIGKVVGGFLSSAFVHAFSVRGVLAGDWSMAAGEAKFFALNGLAVVFEGIVQYGVKQARKKNGWRERQCYDAWIGRAWWIGVLLATGRNFARGWVKAGLVREMAFM